MSEYVNDIHLNMKISENETQPDPCYMKRQFDINENTRAILVDWLHRVHDRFHLLPETMFIMVNLIDRYMSLHQVRREEKQLIGAASMLIAAKYEEIYPPSLRDLLTVTQNNFKRE